MVEILYYDIKDFKFGDLKANKLTVPFSRYGGYTEILTFPTEIKEKLAVKVADLCLDFPITKARFERFKADWSNDDFSVPVGDFG